MQLLLVSRTLNYQNYPIIILQGIGIQFKKSRRSLMRGQWPCLLIVILSEFSGKRIGDSSPRGSHWWTVSVQGFLWTVSSSACLQLLRTPRPSRIRQLSRLGLQLRRWIPSPGKTSPTICDIHATRTWEKEGLRRRSRMGSRRLVVSPKFNHSAQLLLNYNLN